MSLETILAISGKPGLYQLVTQTRGRFVAESLIDKKRISVGIQQNVSVLSETAIYTYTEEVPLKTVLLSIKTKENGGPTSVGHKDGKHELQNYFAEILPDYDQNRVYVSDIKKVLQWYNLLQQKSMLDLLESTVQDAENEEE